MRHHFFPPHLRRRIKEGVSVLLSPFQGETQKGFQLVETSPQPSPERRGRSISSPIRGGQRRGFLWNAVIPGFLHSINKRSHPLGREFLRSICKRSHLPLPKAQATRLASIILHPANAILCFAQDDASQKVAPTKEAHLL
jgi:hypothetical protein